jgi:hypothetical protein
LNWLKGTAVAAAKATLYIGLFTTNPADTGIGSAPADGTEATGNGYARVALTTASGWSAITASGTTQQLSNAGTITFPTASGSWGGSGVTAWGIWDASTSGNLIAYGALTGAPVVIANGYTPSLAAGQLALSLD